MTDSKQQMQTSSPRVKSVRSRIYKYDNAKALLIFLVVLGHMNRGYVSDSMTVRWVTLWLYTFHMPAFLFLSGLMHKRYVLPDKLISGAKCETAMRWDKFLGYFICAIVLKLFLQYSRLAMGSRPKLEWIREDEIPWFLFVLAAYEVVFFLLRRLDARIKPCYIVTGLFVLSAVGGYFPIFDDTLCSSRFFNFLPIYGLGYYLDMRDVLEWLDKRWVRIGGAAVIVISILICANGNFHLYEWRKWFTGRRSYDYLMEFFPYANTWGWAVRLAVWGIALLMVFAVIAVFPNRDMGYWTTIGKRTFQIYFWHRPICFWIKRMNWLPKIVVALGGSYDESMADYLPGRAFHGSGAAMQWGFLIYIGIAILITLLYSLKVFEHPTKELMSLGSKISRKFQH